MSDSNRQFYDLSSAIDEAFKDKECFPKEFKFNLDQAAERVYSYILKNKSNLLDKYKNLQNLFDIDDMLEIQNKIYANTAAVIANYTHGKKSSCFFHIEVCDCDKPKQTVYKVRHYT